MTTLPAQYAWTRPTTAPGTPIPLIEGDVLHDGRGGIWFFDRISRPAYGHSTGRVQVHRACQNHTSGPGHFWCNGTETREFFPSVFDLYLGDCDGVEA